ncbi:topoisomerase DNA-binding C4 zinc finger domain-containing protein [Gammaproteobacteria bacterium]|jgi:ssDNA-binding Zn-finger/Zn-ribbon topoisomerase 1|nr:topoisomerase DNA-binding C4 zinc finger domain-containing protein [Gammaproteobacteria bacterium]
MAEIENNNKSERLHYCPRCKKSLRRIQGKMGPFWGCTGFPDCRTSFNDVDGVPSEDIDEHYRCPLCTRRLIKADKTKGDYWFCSGYSKGCKVTLPDHEGVPEAAYQCQQCSQLLVKRSGKNGVFWGCSCYPSCSASYNDDNNRPEF